MTLGRTPIGLVETRDALHQLAYFAVAPAHYHAIGRMGLRSTPGGFGTPEFEGRVARVEGDLLVHEQNGNVASQKITTVRAAAGFFGVDYAELWFSDFHDPLEPADPDVGLAVDPLASRFLGEWFQFGFEVLERLRLHGREGDDVSEVQLWPEHFDAATELGDYDRAQRASYGASPGDEAHPEPYLYVAAWSEIDRGEPYWNDPNFNGASLGFAELMASEDRVATGLEFLLQGYRVLHGD